MIEAIKGPDRLLEHLRWQEYMTIPLVSIHLRRSNANDAVA
jgi:hypothetical protein